MKLKVEITLFMKKDSIYNEKEDSALPSIFDNSLIHKN